MKKTNLTLFCSFSHQLILQSHVNISRTYLSSYLPTSLNVLVFLFAAFEAANFQIDFFGNPVMRTAQ